MMNTLKNNIFLAISFGLIVFLFPFNGMGADAPKILKGHSSTINSVVLAKNLNQEASANNVRIYLNYGLEELNRGGGGYIRRVKE